MIQRCLFDQVASVAKTCFRCHATKPLGEFYRHPQRRDGHSGKCRSCTRVDVRKNRLAKREQYNKYDTARYQSRGGFLRDPIKLRATKMVNSRVRSGTLVRPTVCSRCPSMIRIEAHHTDYTKPLDVVWLCRLCHGDEHAQEKLRAK